jgi:hypothetical protein
MKEVKARIAPKKKKEVKSRTPTTTIAMVETIKANKALTLLKVLGKRKRRRKKKVKGMLDPKRTIIKRKYSSENEDVEYFFTSL